MKLKKNLYLVKDLEHFLIFTELKKTKLVNDRLDRYDKKKYTQKIKKNLRENLNVGEKVLVLAERIQKNSAPGKFYKQSVQNVF